MTFTIVIILIVTLVILAIAVNAIQQHKQRVDLERRQTLHRYRLMLDGTEDMIAAASNFPVGKGVLLMLYKRAIEALQGMLKVSPSNELKQRLSDYEERLKNTDPNDQTLLSERIDLPENDKQIIAMINAVKKLRTTLRQEHSRGKVDTQLYLAEERRLVKIQVTINVESLVRRGGNAYKSGMLGSARQYYEKAMKTLQDQPFSDDYITNKQAFLSQELSMITDELRDTNARDAREKKQDDIEELFQPKKKW